MSTGVLMTVNDRSTTRSSILTLFGNPNDYASYFRGVDLTNSGHWQGWMSRAYDKYHAVTVDSRSRRVFYSSNVYGGGIVFESIYFNDTEQWLFEAPPISKQVNITVVFRITCKLFFIKLYKNKKSELMLMTRATASVYLRATAVPAGTAESEY